MTYRRANYVVLTALGDAENVLSKALAQLRMDAVATYRGNSLLIGTLILESAKRAIQGSADAWILVTRSFKDDE